MSAGADAGVCLPQLRLVHSFMPGLRFTGALSYATSHKGHRRWLQVPMPREPHTPPSWLAMGQAACVVTQRAATLRELERARQRLQQTTSSTPQLDWLGPWGLGLIARSVPPTEVWGQLKGGLGGKAWLLLVQGATLDPSVKRWIWVTGLEHQVREEASPASGPCTRGQLRALFALDVSLPSPWGTGFNVRIAAMNATPAGGGHRQTWVLRGLDGRMEAVTLVAAMALQRA